MRSLAPLMGSLVLAAGLHAAEPARDPAGPTVNTSTSARPDTGAAQDAAASSQQPAGSEAPSVATTQAAAETSAPAGTTPGPAATPDGPTGRRADARAAADRIELGATQITGNAELPRVMYVVPWKRAELGDLAGKPARSLLDEVLAPVDRDVFRRQNRYYDALQPDAPKTAP